jgi:hypothetical protein
MASYTNPSSTYLTSATNFQGVPISQLLAALGAPEPSSTFAAPPVVQHGFGLRGIRGSKPDPRNRPRPRATTQTTAQTTQPAPAPTTATSSLVDPVSTSGLKGAALQNAYAQNRAAMRARRQQEAQDLEAIKATNRERLKQEALDRPKKEAERALAESDALQAWSLAEEEKRLKAIDEHLSSLYPATTETPVSNRYQEVEGMLGDMEARQAAQGLDARDREAAIQSKYGTEEARRATESMPEYIRAKNKSEAEMRKLRFNVEQAERKVRWLNEEVNSRRADERRRAEALRRAELEARGIYEWADPDPVLHLNDPSRLLELPSRMFPSVSKSLKELYQTATNPISYLNYMGLTGGPTIIR